MKALILVLTLTASAALAAPAPAPSKSVKAPKKIANVMKATIQSEIKVCISADEFFASKWRRSLPRKKIHSYC
jgi:hypothetical protein